MRRVLIAVAATVALCGAASAPAHAEDDDPAADVCTGAGTAIVVDTAARSLTLCEQGAAIESYPVAIGGNGAGKEREGDGKTPLGTYALAAPRRSSDYGTFIPIGFPTAAQKKRGVTGGSIGIHGPDRRLRALGRAAVTFGWTRGCVAVGSDVEMRSIARWVEARRARSSLSIEIR